MSDSPITRLLNDVDAGIPGARDRLFERVKDELRAMARGYTANESDKRAPGATSLVGEAYVRLANKAFVNRRHLFAAYARVMQELLVDSARKRRAAKRGGGQPEQSLPATHALPSEKDSLDALEVTDLLAGLRQANPRAADVVELRFFGGLSEADIAEVLGVAPRTVRRDWLTAREWLRGRLTSG